MSELGLLAPYRQRNFLKNSSLKATKKKKKKKIGYGSLKNLGELSRAILALLFKIGEEENITVPCISSVSAMLSKLI